VNAALKTVLHNGQFVSAWLRNPLRIGALWPSGLRLAHAMAAQVDLGRAGSVVELGAGTGAITRALLARGVVPERLVLVEKYPALVGILEHQFPRATVLQADATFLRALLADAGVEPPGTVVSGLPLLSMRKLTRMRVLLQIFGVLGAGGTMVQFTYSPLPPIPGALATSLGVRGTRVAAVSRNLPPAAVWVYARRTEARDMTPCQ
jgi:phosphatidylethanolamine/phosphatidyl-N-methylethanolamine N-methyltransferase